MANFPRLSILARFLLALALAVAKVSPQQVGMTMADPWSPF